jgi:hypothetical protein
LSPDVEALPENLNCAEKQLRMSRSKDETRHQKVDWFTEVLMEKDKLIQDAKVTIEQLEIRDQDANGSIEDLRIKIPTAARWEFETGYRSRPGTGTTLVQLWVSPITQLWDISIQQLVVKGSGHS